MQISNPPQLHYGPPGGRHPRRARNRCALGPKGSAIAARPRAKRQEEPSSSTGCCPGRSTEVDFMKSLLFATAALLTVAAFSGSAEAGCVKGAVVGGIGGHMVGHGA